MSRPSITLRPMKSNDIQAGMRLKTIAGWNQTMADWQLYLKLNPTGCFVAVHKGQVVGTVTAVCYSDRIAWIGMMLVEPDFRRSGIASRLMQRALAGLKNCQTIKLDATPIGKKVYDRLGFKDDYIIYRMGLAPQEDACDNYFDSGAEHRNQGMIMISPLRLEDWPAIAKLDRKAFGANREAVLKSIAEMGQRTALKYVTETDEVNGRKIRGYCTGRPGSKAYQIGPLIAETTTEAIALVKAALYPLAGQRVVLDVPAYQEDLLTWLMSIGFQQQRSFIRMYYQHNKNPGSPQYVFAISGPELG